jgi:high-affinity iron transporter
MLSALILVFREVLEAALIVTIVAAATRSVAARWRWINAGIALGALGALLVALLAGQIGELADGVGLELFNAGVLLAAVGMIGWHVIWMARHGRALAAEMNTVGREVTQGSRPLWALLLVIALAVLREGSEVVLFLYGLVLSGSGSEQMAIGAGAGLAAGVGLGLALYWGLLRIPMRHFFSATNGLLLLLAAGLAAQAAGFLNQADLLPTLGRQLWDSSWLLTEQSLLGQTLHTLIGYQARPMGVQVLAYLITVVLLISGMKLCQLKSVPASEAQSQA